MKVTIASYVLLSALTMGTTCFGMVEGFRMNISGACQKLFKNGKRDGYERLSQSSLV